MSTEWIDEQLFTIPWGPDSAQLKISPPLIDDQDTPADTTDDIIWPGGGPEVALVAENEDFIFASYDKCQLKGFDRSGSLIFNYSYGEGQYVPEMYSGTVQDVVVDSLNLIYISSFPPITYVPVLNFSGEIVDSLYPFNNDSSRQVDAIYLDPNGEFIFLNMTSGFMTFKHGNFEAGGSGGLIASNGSYYSATVLDSVTLRFNRYEDPNPSGSGQTRQYTILNFPSAGFETAYIIRGGNGDTLYVDVRKNDYISYEVWIFDLSYNLLDKLQLAPIDNQYDWRVPPFVARDGSIYEFRVMDDGLHVIKWTKQ